MIDGPALVAAIAAAAGALAGIAYIVWELWLHRRHERVSHAYRSRVLARRGLSDRPTGT